MLHVMEGPATASAKKADTLDTLDKKDLQLERLEIERAENGFVVRCIHRPKAEKSRGMIFIEPEEYVFQTVAAMLEYVESAWDEKATKKKAGGKGDDDTEYVAKGREDAA